MNPNYYYNKTVLEYDLTNDNRFLTTLNNINQSVILVDHSGTILFANKKSKSEFLEKIGKNSARYAGKINKIIDADNKENFKKSLHQVFKGESVTKMLSFPNGNSDPHRFRVIMNPVFNEQGLVDFATLDITVLKNNQLHNNVVRVKTSQRNNLLIEQPDLIFRINPNGVITFVNVSYCKYFGKYENELVGKNFFDLLPEQEKNKSLTILQRLRPSAPTYDCKRQILDTDNTVRWLKCTDYGIFDSNGKLSEIQIEGTYLTKDKNYEVELQKTNEKLYTILKAIPDIVFLYDSEANILDCYASSVMEVDIPTELLIGNNIDNVFPHHVIDNVKENIKKCLETNEIQVIEDWVEINNDIFWYETKFINSGNKKVISISRNITGQKKIESELLHAKNKAGEAERLKTAFLANISHEIRTPMNAIVGFSNLMMTPEITKEQIKEYAKIINSSSDQLLSVIDDLIDMSRIQSHQSPIKYQETELAGMLTQVQLLYENTSMLRNIELKVHPDETYSKFIISTDEDKLKQIFSKLIGNAIKYSKGDSIEFGYLVKKEDIEFFVKDNGQGIPTEFHDIIFDRFSKIESEENFNRGGTGVGLSIAKSVIETLGGTIWVESQMDIGTQFYFTLPIKNFVATRATEPTDFDTLAKNCWAGKKILIAEDSDKDYRFFCDLMQKSGMSVLRARSGVEALSLTLSDEPHLILMNTKLPVMNGLTAVSAIRKHFRKLPIVAIVDYQLQNGRNRANEAGCNDYLEKPINKKHLFSILLKFLKVVDENKS